MQRGLLFIISAPGGAGKGTICRALSEKRNDIYISISATSRDPRTDEIDGKNYYFKTLKQFKEMIKNGELIEWVEFCGNYYGTPKEVIENKLNEGKNVILELDVVGAKIIKDMFPGSVLIFIITPTYAELVNRLRDRGETEERIKVRTNKSVEEMAEIYNYDYIVINDKLEDAVNKMENIIDLENSRPFRNKELIENFFKD